MLVERGAAYTQGVSTLASSYGTFSSGVGTLASGANELAAQTNDLDRKALDSVKDQLSDFLNPQFTQQDFVNGSTEDIDTVQFIYMTDQVKAPKTAKDTATEKPEQTFLQKLATLFGITLE